MIYRILVLSTLVAALFVGLSAATTSSETATVFAKESNYDFDADYQKTLDKLAKLHRDIAKKWDKAGFETRAEDHYRRCVIIDPDNMIARKALGYKKKDGRWVLAKKTLREDTVKEKDEKEKAEKTSASVAKILEKATKEVKKLIEEASEEGTKENVRKAADLISFYAPEDAEVAKLRGFEEHETHWLRPKLVASLKASAKFLEDATEGEEEAKVEPDIAFLNIEWHRRKSPRIIVRTAFGEIAGKRTMKISNATLDFCSKELGLDIKEPLSKKAYYYTRIKLATDYYAFIDKQTWADEQKAFRKKLTGMGLKNPWGFMTRSPLQSGSNDMLSNTLALNCQRKLRGTSSPPVIFLGYSYYVTGRLLGSTSTKRYTLETKKSGTAVRGKSLAPTFGGPRYGPAYFRNLAKWNIAINKDPSLRKLAQLAINEVREHHAAKGFALFEFLMEEHREVAVKWMKTKFKTGKEDFENLAKALGTDLKGLTEKVNAWIWTSY